jgi:putative endopeptidase
LSCYAAAIGAVICHEITHGFDDQGRKYDLNGELNDWWTGEDAKEYEKRATLLVEQFGEYTVHGVAVNGKLCLGENVADLVRNGLQALQRPSLEWP